MRKKSYKIVSILILTILVIQSISLKTYASDVDGNLQPENTDVEISNPVSDSQPTQENTPETPEVIPMDTEIQNVLEEVTQVEEKVESLSEPVDTISDATENQIDIPGGSPDSKPLVEDALEKVEEVDQTLIEDVKEDITEIKENLTDANKQEYIVENTLAPSVDAAIATDTKANEIEKDVNDLSNEVDTLIDNIENATSAKEVNDLFEEVKQKVEDSEVSLEEKKTAFENLQSAFDTTIKKLAEADNNMDAELVKAKENAEDLEGKLQDLDTQIATLDQSSTLAEEALKDDATAATTLEERLMANYKNTQLTKWEKARNKMFIILEDYYIPQFVDKDATNISFEHVTGFDTQDLNYNIVKYTDKENVEHTMYFNYDLIDKIYKEDDLWYHLGNSSKIVLYEKTVDEINADNYLRQYFAGKRINIKDYANSGKLDVFKLTDANGNASYMVREEYEKAVEDGIINAEDATKVEINANSLAKGGSNYLHETEDAQYVSYLRGSNELYNKFKAYNEKVDTAKSLVSQAHEEAGTLVSAVNTLSTNKANLKIKSILSEEEMAKLESVMTEEEIANLETMTVKEAIKFLNDLVEKAKQKVNNAIINYNLVKKQRNDIEDQLDEIIDRLTPTPTPAPSDDTPTTPDVAPSDVTADATVTPILTAQTPIAPTATITDDVTPLAPQAAAILPTNAPQGVGDDTTNVADGQNGVTIEDETTPLSDRPTNNQTAANTNIANIEDPETPLAATPILDMTNPNYWWLLLIALMIVGLVNYYIYKRVYEENKK